MAIKFPVIRPEVGEIVHPDDFNLNVGQFSSEINGNLDSDNLKEPLNNKQFEKRAFRSVFVD